MRIALLLACLYTVHSSMHAQSQGNLDLFIDYPDSTHLHESHSFFTSDSIYLFVENGFEKESLEILLNDSTVATGEFTTNHSLGAAGMLKVGLSSDTQEMGIELNEQYFLVSLLGKRTNLMTLNIRDGILEVKFLSKPPVYE